jgi:DNA-binding NarL/FixJ family response regulator
LEVFLAYCLLPIAYCLPMPRTFSKMPKNKISVLLVDDHSLVRRGFRRMLEDESDILVAGEASSGAEAVELARKLKPQVILMDCALQGESGINVTRTIMGSLPETAVLMLSMHSEETLVRQSFEAGARGYILKNASDLDLAAAIRRVLDGDIVLDAQLKRAENLKGERTAGLTARELEVLQLIAMGKSNKEIASELDVSVNTVAVHRANIMNALGLHKTAELVVYAIRNGLVNLP